jgi:serine protease AprX
VLSKLKAMKKIVLVVFILTYFSGFSQEDAWVYFTNKPSASTYLSNPLSMLSQRSLDRRSIQNIALDMQDVPVEQSYITQIENAPGILVMAKSKWLNALHVRGSQASINALTNLSFVSSVKFANTSLNTSGKIADGKNKGKVKEKFQEAQVVFQYGTSANQIQMLNGHQLHQNNHTGTGKIIAVMDNGFPGVDVTQPFQRLRDNNLILGGYDFVNRSANFYNGGSHGTMVLSTMGGYKVNELIGTAPDAGYYLFKTEATDYENPLEESLWVEAAEMADSLGVDIINTSLGYSTFDNPNYDYTYANMNGATSFITRGANVAFTRGMICVTSAGNSGSSSWQYITAPADAYNTLTVGAVNNSGTYASFSSIGPSFDGRIKPDVCAQGVSSVIATASGTIAAANGTSFSSPIIAGMVASLWQALPNLTNVQILQLIKQSAHIYNNPTAQLGYGIPNFYSAYQNGLVLSNSSFDFGQINVYPNPFQDSVSIVLPFGIEASKLTIYNTMGQIILEEKLLQNYNTIQLNFAQSGMYLYTIATNSKTFSGKLLKK